MKIRYCDAIDNREYEPLMQNLLDTHLSVAGLKQITNPIDILNKDDFERELRNWDLFERRQMLLPAN